MATVRINNSIFCQSNAYLGHEETSFVVELVRGVAAETMIEFGCNLGITARTILRHVPSLQRYVGIDVPPEHKPTLACQNSEVPDVAGSYATGDPRFELLIRPNGSLDLTAQDLPTCEAVFIDGDHSEGVVIFDSELARSVMKSGIIIWHDFNNPYVEVTKAIETLCGRGWPIEHIESTWLAFCLIS
jgi:predicted O-methyltransferase YrrM